MRKTMIQTLVKINWPKGVNCYPAGFREELAKSELLPSEFFHYGNAIEAWDVTKGIVDGKLKVTNKVKITKTFEKAIPLNGRPPVRVIGGKTWVGVIADPNCEDMLLPHIAAILNVATKIANSPVKIQVEQRQFGISYTEYPVKYMLRELVLARRNEKARSEDLAQLVHDRIWGGASGGNFYGIDGTCAAFGFEPPSREMLDIKVFPLKNIGIALRPADGKSNEYMSLIDAEIWMNADLSGVWQVGNLISRGYGRIIKPFGESV